jgi:HAD superfamily phosphoserine phosphatase-like hydrolase
MHRSYLSVFDLDHTLIKGNTSFLFCFYLYKCGVFSFFSVVYSLYCYFLHRICGMSLEMLHQKIFKKLLQGRSFASFEKYILDFTQRILPSYFYIPALSRLRRAQHLGDYTVILSSSPSFLVKTIAQYLGVDEWRASEYSIAQDRKFFAIASLMQGEDKASYVQILSRALGIKKESITAYSDSYLDLPFLLSAGNAIAVNPDRKLRAFFTRSQGQII